MEQEAGLRGCFGANDNVFAVHPLDQERAFNWLISLRRAGATFSDAEQQVRTYLESQKCRPEFILEQLRRLRTKFEPWLP
jgi:hypothetical protein